MKKIYSLTLFVLSVLLLSGCIDNQKGIDYHGSVDVPSIIEVDIEDVPERFDQFVTVDSEVVLKVSFDTSEVLWDKVGDHSIKVIIDYTDGTSLTFNSVLRLVLSETLGVPRIIGVKNRLISVGTEGIDLLEGIAFTDDSNVVDSGILGSVEFGVEGVYTIVYYVEDDDGNFVSSSSFVIVGDNLPHYENLLDTFITVNASDKATLREYALLYTAAFEKNTGYNIKEILNYYGYFINVNVFEQLLKRDLREDEIKAVEETKILFKRNDRKRYEEFFDVTLSAEENEYFDNVYDIFNDFARGVHPFSLDANGSIANTPNIELYLTGSTDLNPVDVASLAFYRVYSNLSIDPIYFDVIAATSYEFDYRLLQVTDTAIFDNVKSLVEWLHPSLLLNPEDNQNNLPVIEQQFYEIYAEFYTYKVIYEIKTYLVEEGYDIDMKELEELYFLLMEAYQTDDDFDSLLSDNIIYLENVEELLGFELSRDQRELLVLLEEGFNHFYEAPYTASIELFKEYLTPQEIDAIKQVYRLYSEKGNHFEPLTYDYVSMYELLGRVPDTEFMTAMGLATQYHISRLSLEHIAYIKTFQFSKEEVESLLLGSLYTSFDPGVLGDIIVPLGKINLLNRLSYLYGNNLDQEGIRHIDNLVAVMQAHNLDNNVIDLLITSNDYDLFVEKYNLNFTAYEEKQMKDYIEWSSAYIYQYINDTSNLFGLSLCIDDCHDQMNEIFNYLYPSTHLLDYGFLNTSSKSLEIILGKEPSEPYDNAVSDVRAAYTKYNLLSTYYGDKLKLTNYKMGTITPFTFDENTIGYIDLLASIYDKRGNLPRRTDLLSNVLHEDALEYLSQEEFEVLEYFYIQRVSRQNIDASSDILYSMYLFNRQDLMIDYVIALGAFKEHNIMIVDYTSFDIEYTADLFTPAQQVSVDNIYTFLLDVNSYEIFIEPLNIPIGVEYDLHKLLQGVMVLGAHGYNPNQNSTFLAKLFTQTKDTAPFYASNPEDVEAALYYLEFKFRYQDNHLDGEQIRLFNTYIPEFEEKAAELRFDILSQGGSLQWDKNALELLLGMEFTIEQSAIFWELNMENGAFLHRKLQLFEAYGLIENQTYTINEFQTYYDEYFYDHYMEMLENIPSGFNILNMSSLFPMNNPDPGSSFSDFYVQHVEKFNEKLIAFEQRLEREHVSKEELISLRNEAMMLFDVTIERDTIYYRNFAIDGTTVFDLNEDLELRLNTLFMYDISEKILEEYMMEARYAFGYDFLAGINLEQIIPVKDVYAVAKMSSLIRQSVNGPSSGGYISYFTYEHAYDVQLHIEWIKDMLSSDPLTEELYEIYHNANLSFARTLLRSQFQFSGIPFDDQLKFFALEEVIALASEDGITYLEELLWIDYLSDLYGVTEEQMALIEELFSFRYENDIIWD